MKVTELIAQVAGLSINASASVTAVDLGDLSRYKALRFLAAFTGSGTPQIQIRWKLPNDTNIQTAVEGVTLASDYAEVPVRAVNADILIAETGGANGIVVTAASIIGVTR